MKERFFATEILGAEARTPDGKKLGKVDDIVADTRSGEIRYILLKDCSDLCDRFKKDPDGRRVVEFRTMELADGTVILSLSP